MVAPKEIEKAVKKVTDQESFVRELLGGALEWSIPDGVERIDDISLPWSQDELRARGLDGRLVSGQAWQIQSLRHGQPWGIFLLEFANDAHFTTRGGLYGATGTLRQILRGLVPSRRHDSALPAWQRENLLFICTHDYTQFRFAYFKAPKDEKQVAPLASFGWNQGDTHLRTLCEYNLPALAFPEDRGVDGEAWVRQWAGAIDKTRVTEQFYKDYVRILDLMEKSLAGLDDTEEQPSARRNYAQLVLGRLMFLYFLQKKGWLGVAGQTTASGGRLQPDFDYLNNHFRRVAGAEPGKKAKGFYEFITGLFFDVLNRPRDQRPGSVTRTYGEVPFLNGGLFHRTSEELYQRESLGLPDEAFGHLFAGPDALFVKYNFTVKEDEPLDVTVAVDPEMLDLVFERQLIERQSKGAFYTPISVVGFMCERALAEHLDAQGILSHDKVVALMETESAAGLTLIEAQAISQSLWAVTICDAAVGSGAFPIGMLHRLVRLHYALYTRFPQVAEWLRKQLAEVNRSLPRLKPNATESQVKFQLKRALIQNNLFGVDIEASAIQIAQLRMWLSLAVEHEAEFVHDIPPLPNLDHNLRLGNSLVSHYFGIDFEMETDTRSERLRDILDQLDKREADYYELSDEREKDEQRQEIDLLHWRLLEEGIQDELRTLPRRREAIAKVLRQRKHEALFPDMMDYTPAERAELAWLEKREPELQSALPKLRAEQADLRKEEQTKHPVLWKVHFSRIFRRGGFDIVILNPPYVSTQGASELEYIPALSAKLGFNDDLYLFFTFRAFGLPDRHYSGIARPCGVVCYITSDTYFTLETKTRMRQLLQAKDLRLLVQCDPFRQTVDTAIFLARNGEGDSDGVVEFIQARPVTNRFPTIPFGPTWQAGAVAQLPPAENDVDEEDSPAEAPVKECEHDGLRRYQVPVAVYARALKEVFFEPNGRNIALYSRFMEPVKRLVVEWWDRIEDSRKFEKNRVAIEAYHRTLKPGDVTIAGLICEGGQGMRTANNGRFLGYLEGTPQAQEILKRRKELADRWEGADRAVAAGYRSLKTKGGDFPEIADALKERFAGEANWTRLLGFRRGEIYRIVPREAVVDVEGLSDEQRQAITHHGIDNAACWVPFRKGDPEGNKWVSFDPLYICWNVANVVWLSDRSNPLPRWQGFRFFFTDGITWTAVANHVAMKSRLQPKCVFDADSMRLTPVPGTVSALVFLSLLNSDLLSYFKWRFLKNTQKYEIGDLRLLPIVIPSPKQRDRLESLAEKAVGIQTDILQNGAERQAELDAIQAQVNEAVEELYGVRGLGPFDEF